MGGFIKVTLREKNKITTKTLHTSVINGFLGIYENIFENDISDLIVKNEVNPREVVESFHSEMNTLTPFGYGYIFIDRIKKKVFYLNNYDAISHFATYDFKENSHQKLKKQNFKVKIKNDRTHKIIDIRKDFGNQDYNCYVKLYSAIPYIEKAISEDVIIEDTTSIESILEELMHLRKERTNQGKTGYSNDLIITKFKSWEFIEDNANKKNYTNLFNYLKDESLLSKKDIYFFEKEIENID